MLRQPGSLEQLLEHAAPAVWIQSVWVPLDVVDDLERQLAAIETELRPIARTDQPVQLHATSPGIGPLLALTITADEIGEISQFAGARNLIS